MQLLPKELRWSLLSPELGSPMIDFFLPLRFLCRVTGLVHKTELSWDSVVSVDSLVQKGQVIRVKIIDLDAPSGRLGLSLKQIQPDPIKMTLDTLEWGPFKSMPSEIQALVDKIKVQEGVEDVYLGRQAVESKISSQELVVYLTKVSYIVDNIYQSTISLPPLP